MANSLKNKVGKILKIKESTSGNNAGVTGEFTEIFKLAKAYFLQETLAPLRKVKHKIVQAILAVMFLGIGFFLLLIAVLRVLQSETGSLFNGNESFAPYLITFFAGIILAAGLGWYVLRNLRGKS